jgi:hypothetical protein
VYCSFVYDSASQTLPFHETINNWCAFNYEGGCTKLIHNIDGKTG